jgi:hypothetical protein
LIAVGVSPFDWTGAELREYAASVCPSLPLDLGIVRAVRVLRESGFHTIESCQGGDGHCYPEPTIEFEASRGGGWHALGLLMDFGFPIKRIGQLWTMTEGMPAGPVWHVTFWRRLD